MILRLNISTVLILAIIFLEFPNRLPAVDFFVANFHIGTISKMDTSGQSRIFADLGAVNPTGLVQDADGNLYVANQNVGTISKIDRNGNVSTFASGMGNIWNIAIDRSGYFYTLNYSTNTVYRIDPSGNAVPYVTTGLDGPQAIAIDPHGNLYISNYAGNNPYLVKVDQSGNVIPVLNANFLHAMTFDSAGNLYVSVFDGNGAGAGDWGVDKITPSGVRTAYARGIVYGLGMDFDDQGNLYVTEGNDSRISVISTTGQIVRIASPTSVFGLSVVNPNVVPETSAMISFAIPFIGFCLANLRRSHRHKPLIPPS